MMHPYHHVRTEDGRESLTVFLSSGQPVVVTGDHPQFAAILEGAQTSAPADDLRDLADLSTVVAKHFDTLSERVSVANGRVYFDGDEVDSAITQQIKRCLDDPDVGDWKPLVRFMENVAANPNEHSREQLFDWLRNREFTITTSGNFIAYKGVSSDDDGAYVSSSSGHGIVNGEWCAGRLPNHVGATVEMPRSDVQHDPTRGCHTGLHVGTHKYAERYNRAGLLTVLVNPRDVVSVPTDCNAEKMRVCRYVVSCSNAFSSMAPEDSAAIEENAFEQETFTYHGRGYVRAGIYRMPLDGDVYLSRYPGTSGAVLRAFGDHSGRRGAEPQEILRLTDLPKHGDYRSADNGGEFYRDCGLGEPCWIKSSGPLSGGVSKRPRGMRLEGDRAVCDENHTRRHIFLIQ